MKALLFSNPLGYSSGYAVQSYHLCKVLLAQGHEIFFIDCSIPSKNPKDIFHVGEVRALYAAQHPEFLANIDERIDVLGHPNFHFVRYMYDTFPRPLEIRDFNVLVDKFQTDLLLLFIDCWIINSTVDDRFHCPAVCWLPIHFEPVEIATVRAAKKFDAIVTLSKDGLRRLPPLLPDVRFFHVPHIIDFRHYTDDAVDRAAVRRELGVPADCYLVTCVMNNSEDTERKSFCSNLEAFGKFRAARPEARLYLHSKLDGAVDLHGLIDYFGLREFVHTSDQFKMGRCGLTFDWVVRLYKASDVVLATTCSEGFGIPIIEAQAVGCPVVASNNTAPPDNVFNGELVDCYQKKFVLMNTSYWWLPDVDKTAAALDAVYRRTPAETAAKAAHGMRAVRATYTTRALADGWAGVMAHMADLRARQLAARA